MPFDMIRQQRTTTGWSRLDSFSGKFLREQAARGLKAAVLQEAKNPVVLEAASPRAKEEVLYLLKALDVQIRIQD
jgi:hypothetical protein